MIRRTLYALRASLAGTTAGEVETFIIVFVVLCALYGRFG